MNIIEKYQKSKIDAVQAQKHYEACHHELTPHAKRVLAAYLKEKTKVSTAPYKWTRFRLNTIHYQKNDIVFKSCTVYHYDYADREVFLSVTLPMDWMLIEDDAELECKVLERLEEERISIERRMALKAVEEEKKRILSEDKEKALYEELQLKYDQ